MEQAGEEHDQLAEYASSDGEDTLATPSPSVRVPQITGVSNGKKKRKKTPSGLGRVAPEKRIQYKFRIYRANNTYHVASIALNATVSDLIPYLNSKLLHDPEREKHRLYLKERGRGRNASRSAGLR